MFKIAPSNSQSQLYLRPGPLDTGPNRPCIVTFSTGGSQLSHDPAFPRTLAPLAPLCPCIPRTLAPLAPLCPCIPLHPCTPCALVPLYPLAPLHPLRPCNLAPLAPTDVPVPISCVNFSCGMRVVKGHQHLPKLLGKKPKPTTEMTSEFPIFFGSLDPKIRIRHRESVHCDRFIAGTDLKDDPLWCGGEPNNYDSSQTLLSLDGKTHCLNDFSTQEQNHFVCEQGEYFPIKFFTIRSHLHFKSEFSKILAKIDPQWELNSQH